MHPSFFWRQEEQMAENWKKKAEKERNKGNFFKAKKYEENYEKRLKRSKELKEEYFNIINDPNFNAYKF